MRSAFLYALIFIPRVAKAVVPTLILDVEGGSELLLSHSMFGRIPSMERSAEPTLVIQYSESLLCEPETSTTYAANTLLMVPRGVCTFETKARNAEAVGAAAMIVYGNLASRYSVNASLADPSVDDIIFPTDKQDYDCARGEGTVDASELVFDDPIPYNSANDDILRNSCGCEFCLVTELPTDSKAHACCAWDLSIYLYADSAMVNTTVNIPAAYMTMSQEAQIQSGATAILYQRWRPSWNISSILIWVMGVFVAALAAYVSAGEYRTKTKKLLKRRDRPRSTTSQSQPRTRSAPPPSDLLQEEVMELTAAHAAGFVVMSSTSLLVLFYFKIYGVVKVFYAFGCSTAVAQVIFYPLSYYVLKRNVMITSHPEIGDITLRDVLCHVVSFALGLTWLTLSFFHPDPDHLLFYWVMQDVFGACMCITFLQVIRLNNIRVASILLIVAFLYDIFFVFVTPYLFGKSVMITVATSGGPPKADPLWCEKYPNDADCQGGNPLPMLLAIPRLLDYAGGSSLLGLGDIVLPGLLLSFAARLDAAKSLVGVATGGRPQAGICPERRNNFFGPIVVAYAVGLAMANLAVYWMRMGQPALLYLVPCCLGTMLVVGRNELQQLWDGPRVLKAADEILHGSSRGSSSTEQHAPLPVEEVSSQEAIAPPSASEDQSNENE